MHFTCTYHYPILSIHFYYLSFYVHFYILHFTIFNSLHSFLLQNTIHTIDISFTNTFSFNAFQEKKKKKSTFPIQLHSSHPFLTSFSKLIYINNRRNCLKNRFNFHLKLTASVILTPSYQPLTREPIKQMENGGKTRKFVWNITRHILVYSI